MKGNEEVISVLNEVLTSELTAINQYFIHSKMCEDWGFQKLAAKKRGESIEEMQHADAVIARILFLEGVPNMQRYFPVKVGEDAIEQHRLDLELEYDAVKRLNDGLAVCREKGDNGTHELLKTILQQEEEGIEWLEAQLHVVEAIGTQRYLAEQLGTGGE
jgi:bacterioferritin